MVASQLPPSREPRAPSLKVAAEYAASLLPRNPKTGQPYEEGLHPVSVFRTSQELGGAAFAYMRFLQHFTHLFQLFALLSVSSMVSNAYGDGLGAAKRASWQNELFLGPSIGNPWDLCPLFDQGSKSVT